MEKAIRALLEALVGPIEEYMCSRRLLYLVKDCPTFVTCRIDDSEVVFGLLGATWALQS